MKKLYVAVIVLTLLMLTAISFAKPWGMRQNTAISAEQQKFFDETRQMRKEMHDKRFELMELYRTPEADKSKIEGLEKEMTDLRTKMQEKARELKIASGYDSRSRWNCPDDAGCGDCRQKGSFRERGLRQGRMMWR